MLGKTNYKTHKNLKTLFEVLLVAVHKQQEVLHPYLDTFRKLLLFQPAVTRLHSLPFV